MRESIYEVEPNAVQWGLMNIDASSMANYTSSEVTKNDMCCNDLVPAGSFSAEQMMCLLECNYRLF